MHSRLKHIPKKRCLMSKWSPESWKDFALSQAPGWINDKTLKNTIGQLRKNPPLVFKDEIKLLKSRLSRVHDGEYFIIQGGDCAETFSDFSSNLIKNKLNILLQMSVLLSYTTSMKTIRIHQKSLKSREILFFLHVPNPRRERSGPGGLFVSFPTSPTPFLIKIRQIFADFG